MSDIQKLTSLKEHLEYKLADVVKDRSATIARFDNRISQMQANITGIEMAINELNDRPIANLIA